MIRTVYMPLSREPDILFGLRVSDLMWVAASAAADLAIWHQSWADLTIRIGIMSILSAAGMALAAAKIEGDTLAQWLVRWIRFRITPRLYLP